MPDHHPAVPTPTPEYKPAPAPAYVPPPTPAYKPAPPPPVPTYHEPAPTYHEPAPVYHEPAPVYHEPAPTYHEPAPTYKPAPAYHEPAPAYKAPAYHEPEHHPAKYAFEYSVKDEYSKNNFGHSEQRDGYKVTGEYRYVNKQLRKNVDKFTLKIWK